MAANQAIFDAYLRHQLYLQRYSTKQSREIIAALDSTEAELVGAIAILLTSIQKNGVLTKTRTKKYAAFLRKIQKIRSGAFTPTLSGYLKELEELVTYELASTQAIFEKHLPIQLKYTPVAGALLASNLLQNGQFNGLTLQQYFTQLEAKDSERIVQIVKHGINMGYTSEQITTSVLSTGGTGKTKQGVRSMVRTTIAGVSAGTQAAWSLANKDIAPTEIYTAVLDGRTTPICASLDGTYFPVGTGPYPPLHINCRSRRVPVVDLLVNDLIGNRPYVRDTRTKKFRRKDFRKETKAEFGSTRWKKMTRAQRDVAIKTTKQNWQDANIGQVDANMTYATWFSKQPATFQKQYLGPTKYEAYTGGAPLGEFVGLNGKFLTLSQLKTKGVL